VTALAMTPVAVVALRNAGLADCEQIWCWNFAPDVRARSKRAEAVAFAEHARWFTRRITDGREPLWIIEEQGAPVGVVRLDVVGGGLSRISIALDVGARGRGIGRCAVAAVCRAFAAPIVAEIFADNLASRACFEACGFRSVVEGGGLLTYYWDPEN
jgi:RimJ/RimL family protein N-acetyltransferase